MSGGNIKARSVPRRCSSPIVVHSAMTLEEAEQAQRQQEAIQRIRERALGRPTPRHAGRARLLNPDEEGPEVRGYATDLKT